MTPVDLPGALTSFVQSVITLVIFLFMLGVLVVVHELGHFIAARLSGVRVLEFGIGFPPRARILRSTGETLYTLNWLPIGGFVKLEGEEGVIEGQGQGQARPPAGGTDTVAPPDTTPRRSTPAVNDPRSFAVAPLWKKLIILLAGVTMNLVLAFAIMTAIALIPSPALAFAITQVQSPSPANTAGLVEGDTIVAVNGTSYDQYGPTTLLDVLRASAGKTVSLTVRRASGGEETIAATLRPASEIDPQHGALGISARSAVIDTQVTHDLPSAVDLGVVRTRAAFGLIIDGLGQLADSIVNRPTEAPPVQGPVGIALGVGDVFWQRGPVATLFLAGLLSANLALVNVLPLPPLDGGRMLMLVIRALVGTRLSLQVERLTYVIGFGFLMVFLVWITFFDIARQVGGGQ